MATISTVAVDFIANVAKYTAGLDTMSKKTKTWSGNTKGDAKDVAASFDATGKSIANLAKGLVGLVAIQKIGAAFANAAMQVSLLADEAEKVGASAGQFDKLRLAAERNGSEIGDVKIAYKELQKSINEALGGTKASIDAFRSLGLSYVSLSKQSPDDQFLRIADALSKVDDQNERTRLGVLLLGKAYTELSPLIAKGGAGIQTDSRGALSSAQIESIDKVTKGFEEVNRVLDTKLKEALVQLAPALTSIAKALTVIIENFGKIAIGIGIAFSPVILSRFTEALKKGVFQVIKFFYEINAKATPTAENMRKVTEAARALGQYPNRSTRKDTRPIRERMTPPKLDKVNTPSVTPPDKSIFKNIDLLFAAFSKLARIGAGYTAAIAASVTVTTLQVFNLTEGFFKFASAITGPALPSAKKRFDDLAKGVANLKSQFLDFVLPEFLRPKKEGFIGPTPLIGPYISPEESARVGQVYDDQQLGLDRAREARKLFEKDVDAFTKKSDDFRNNLNKSLMTPVEELTSALEELDDAFLFGGLGIETYNKRLDELRNSYSRLVTDVAGLTKPKGILEDTRGLPDQKVPSKTRLEPLGNLSLMGMDKPVYNTAGEKLFLDLTIQSTFATADLTKSTLALQAAREKATAMAPQLYESTRTETELLQKRVTDIQTATTATDEYGKKIINAEVASRALAQAQADLFAVATPYWKNIVEFTTSFADGLANAIVAGQNFGEALRNVFQDVLKQIAVLIIRTTILQAIMAAVGLASAPAALAFGQMTGIVGKAAGGPVNAGSPYMVGEVGPELFVPRSNGIIVPNDMMGRESTQVVQNIYVQTGVAQTVRAEMAALLPAFKQQAIAGVVEAKQRGGSYARALSPA